MQHRDGHEAAQGLADALNDPEVADVVVLRVLNELEHMVGEHARPAVATLLQGPHDGLAVEWLLVAGALSPDDISPERLLVSRVDTLAAVLAAGGRGQLLTILGAKPRANQVAMLERFSRVDRPGTATILEAVGAHHPDAAVAKAARKYLLRHRSRNANNR